MASYSPVALVPVQEHHGQNLRSHGMASAPYERTCNALLCINMPHTALSLM